MFCNVPNTRVLCDRNCKLGANKGAIALYNFSLEIGSDLFNRTILDYFDANKNRLIVFKDMYKELLYRVSDTKKLKIKASFESL